jgi:uncharacterized protein (UPF0264 family)
MSLFLASVTNLEEAQIALESGADVIDLKDPEQGALGALPIASVEQVTRFIAGRKLVSATVGDLPMQPETLLNAVQAMSATGVDMVKIGFFPSSECHDCMRALQSVARLGSKLIAVLFADQALPSNALADFAEAGFYGVMLDTATKNGKSLRDHLPMQDIARFVDEAHSLGLFVGLAGSLQYADIAPLSALQPDYLGFRGALCSHAQRVAPIQRQHMQKVQDMLHKCHEVSWRVAA